MWTTRTSTEIHAAEETADPGYSTFAFPEVGDELAKEHAECVRDTVNDHVTHEGSYDNHPSVSPVRGRGDVMVVAVRQDIVLTGRRTFRVLILRQTNTFFAGTFTLRL